MPIQSSSITTSGFAIYFATDGEAWTINPVTVESTGDTAVYSNHMNNTLYNSGTVISDAPLGFAMQFSGAGATLDNFSGGLIRAYNGVGFYESAGTLSNSGSIEATKGVGVLWGGSTMTFTNGAGGDIYGYRSGVDLAGLHGHLTNQGTIGHGVPGTSLFGVELNGASDVTIENDSGGTIHGAKDAVYAHGGAAFTLTNHGTLNGGVYCAPDSVATVTNDGAILGAVLFGGGNDSFIEAARGTSGAVYGRGGNDVLTGGDGADELHGGDGRDVLTGGGGDDRFCFDTLPNATTNMDHIMDFTAGTDKIVLSEADFPGVGAAGVLAPGKFAYSSMPRANQHIVYDSAHGTLFYDDNGSAAGGMTHFATISPHLTLLNTDFVVVA